MVDERTVPLDWHQQALEQLTVHWEGHVRPRPGGPHRRRAPLGAGARLLGRPAPGRGHQPAGGRGGGVGDRLRLPRARPAPVHHHRLAAVARHRGRARRPGQRPLRRRPGHRLRGPRVPPRRRRHPRRPRRGLRALDHRGPRPGPRRHGPGLRAPRGPLRRPPLRRAGAAHQPGGHPPPGRGPDPARPLPRRRRDDARRRAARRDPAPLTFQVAFDAVDPHAQARFWAAGHALRGRGAGRPRAGAPRPGRRHRRRRGRGRRPAVLRDRGAAIRPPGRRRRRDARQPAHPLHGRARAPGGQEPGPPRPPRRRRPGADPDEGRARLEAEVERLEGLGATVLYRHDDVDGRWVTLADPEGNELCLH